MEMRGFDAGIWVLFLWMIGNITAYQPCARKFISSDHMVCVCNATYCDTLDPVSLPPKGFFLKYETSKAGRRLELSKGKFQLNHTSFGFTRPEYIFSASERYQYIKGFGGAHTDAAAINILKLSPAAQDHLLRSYFSESGIEYKFLRLPIACSDFSTTYYTYDDTEYDYALRYFSLNDMDTEMRIPLLHRIMSLSKQPLSLIASPWTGPSWLRVSNQVTGPSSLKGEAGDQYHQTWANYLIRFLDEYARHNITFWAITAQNEAVTSRFVKAKDFPATLFSAEEERDFIIKDLGPALSSSNHRDVHLIILDDSRFLLPSWAKVVLGNSSAAKYVSGIGVHWYMDAVVPAQSTLGATHHLFPDYFLLYTEASYGSWPWQMEVELGSWERGVHYSQSILETLNNFVTGWIDWNLALDMKGGPNWVDNFVDSPILVDASKDEFYKQPMFYHLAHFSKFIPEGSVRVDLTCSRRCGPFSLQAAGFLRPDGAAVVVVLNQWPGDVEFSISDQQVGVLKDVARAYSIQTYLWKREGS